ncbi:MAG TPA: hypothetical protein VIA06_20130 [Candidatus Dormibacteraeota bacterium]|jgi:hypothetical protein|nr:hypothetical protein [Candidatus Dormibacteraeota bacterium]
MSEEESGQDGLDWGLKLAGILVVAGIAPFLDTTIVNVAVPTIAHHLQTPVATIQWVITGYLLDLIDRGRILRKSGRAVDLGSGRHRR